MKVLIVEDSKRLQLSLTEGLKLEGFAVDVVGDGGEALQYIYAYDYDVIVLDLMLPTLSGLAILKKMRARGLQTHVLILSAKDQISDRVKGLNLGADDYLIKPFDFQELLARINTLVRRRYRQKTPTLEIGSLRVDLATHRVSTENDILIQLSPKEYAILEYMILRRGHIVTRDHLLDHLYDGTEYVESNVLDVLICKLRKKIEKSKERIIRTVRGYGYMIE